MGPFRVRKRKDLLPIDIKSIQDAQSFLQGLTEEERGRWHWQLAASALSHAHASDHLETYAHAALEHALKEEKWLKRWP